MVVVVFVVVVACLAVEGCEVVVLAAEEVLEDLLLEDIVAEREVLVVVDADTA